MATHPAPLAPEDVLELPLPEGVSGYELVNGVPVAVTPASLEHGRITSIVAHVLMQYIEREELFGEVYTDTGFVLSLRGDRRRLRGPDVAFVAQRNVSERADADERFGWFAPDLAIEIELSSGRKPGGAERIRDYVEAGVRLVWAIHPRTRSATVYRRDGSTSELEAGSTLDGEDVVPGFLVSLAELFR